MRRTEETGTARWRIGAQARRAIRKGHARGSTAGLAPGYLQCNLVILPRSDAADFTRFCRFNPKPCPLLAVSEPGSPALPSLGSDLDVRTDIPAYCVFRDGTLAEECTDLRGLWQDDHVAFAIGCSFSFEHALLDAGVPLRHIREGRNVAMWRTTIPTTPSGAFHAPLVVSMRPIRLPDLPNVVRITSAYPMAHGAPVHIGDPRALGIEDLMHPDYGDAVEVLSHEAAVFWACGVTTQLAIQAAKLPLAITHKPGHMLVTDLTLTPAQDIGSAIASIEGAQHHG
jgi:uncharacterized protein YcsI (UPF0317 family)